MKQITFGAILPNTKLFGGVKRFFELGAVWIAKGHKTIIFTTEGEPASWFNFPVQVDKLSNLPNHQIDILFITEVAFLGNLLAANAKIKVLYHVGPRVKLDQVLKHPEIKIFSNSSTMQKIDQSKYGIEPIKAYGGVRLPALHTQDVAEKFSKENPFVVMAFGRLSRKGKGTMLVVAACERLHKKGYPVKLLLYDSPLDEKSGKLIQNFKTNVPFEFIVNHPVHENDSMFKRAHVFVSAEKKGGWSNSAAEAMATGVAVIGTKIGTSDFLIHNESGLVVWRFPYFIRKAIQKLYENPDLRIRLAKEGRKRIEQYSWENLAGRIIAYVENEAAGN